MKTEKFQIRLNDIVSAAMEDSQKMGKHMTKQDIANELHIKSLEIDPSIQPKPAPTASTVAQESVLDGLASIDALPTLRDFVERVHEAHESDKPMLSTNVPLNERTMGVTLTALGFLAVDDVTDRIALTTEGRLLIGLKPEGTLDLPVEVAEIIGDVEESELAARYMDGKVAAIDNAINMNETPIHSQTLTWKEAYEHIALAMRETAREFRMGLHVPSVHIKGRVIHYNDDRSTGLSHASALTLMVNDIHHRNVSAGWWNDLATGEPLDRNVGELICLMHSELSEAMEGHRKNLMDDKIPSRPMIEVEFADCVIRIADACGGLKLDLGGALDEKLAYNAQRADHKPENRVKEGGKAY